MIDVKHLSKAFGDNRVLDEVAQPQGAARLGLARVHAHQPAPDDLRDVGPGVDAHADHAHHHLVALPPENDEGPDKDGCWAKVIDVKHLSKAFGDNRVLDDISEHIDPGEKVVIIGPSMFFRMVILGNRLKCWNTIPIWRRMALMSALGREGLRPGGGHPGAVHGRGEDPGAG